MGAGPITATIPTFRLSQGADNFDFDLKGQVRHNGDAFGTWSTDDQNRIAATGAAGAPATFVVDWAFNPKNQLTIASGGQTLLTLAPAAGMRPSFDTLDAVPRAKPNKADGLRLE